MGKILILSVTDHEEHILNKIMETIANEPELNHIAPPLPCNILFFYKSGNSAEGADSVLQRSTCYSDSP